MSAPFFSPHPSYPVETCHLQLPQDVVLRRPLVHVPHQNLAELLGAVEVGPVVDTFVLKNTKGKKKKSEWVGIIREGREAARGVLDDRKSRLISSSFPIILNVILSSSAVYLLPPTQTHTHTAVIPAAHTNTQDSLLESAHATERRLLTGNAGKWLTRDWSDGDSETSN